MDEGRKKKIKVAWVEKKTHLWKLLDKQEKVESTSDHDRVQDSQKRVLELRLKNESPASRIFIPAVLFDVEMPS